MRTAALSRDIAELAVRNRDRGVVGFDIAGAEAGYPPSRHLDAFQYVMRENFHSTIHAGEAFGLPSIWEALQYCGAARLGHGVRIVDDITGSPGEEQLGRLASYVRDRRVCLELCPTSNVNTGVCASVAEHPIGMLRRLRFRVTVNTDNRLMSNTSMSTEMYEAARCLRLGPVRLRVAHDQRHEVGVRPVPGAAACDQRTDQAAVRTAPRGGHTGGDLTTRLRVSDPAVHREPSNESGAVNMPVTVTLVDHPLVADSLARIRDRDTPNSVFRNNLERIGTLLLAEATRSLRTVDGTVETPLTTAPARGAWRCSR